MLFFPCIEMSFEVELFLLNSSWFQANQLTYFKSEKIKIVLAREISCFLYIENYLWQSHKKINSGLSSLVDKTDSLDAAGTVFVLCVMAWLPDDFKQLLSLVLLTILAMVEGPVKVVNKEFTVDFGVEKGFLEGVIISDNSEEVIESKFESWVWVAVAGVTTCSAWNNLLKNKGF